MSSTGNAPAIVVGVSGSPASAGAVRWAADEAERRHCQLRVVLAWTNPPRAFYAHPACAPQEAARRRQRAGQGLAATLRAVLGPQAHVKVSSEVVEGMAERALVELSAGAELLVLGSASGLTAGRTIGPVIRSCLSRAHCPVVVVGQEGSPGAYPELERLTGVIRDGDRALLPIGAVPAPRSGD